MAGTAGAGALRGAPARPNFVFLLTDDQRWDSLGCMGNRIIRTPHIDRLASDGVVFENNFCATAICMTSRACFFTGLNERSHGISDFSVPFTPEALARTYPALLRQAGYRTGFIGKYGVGNKMPEEAFDYWRGFPGQGKYYHERDGKLLHLTRLQEEQSLEFLGGCRKDQPFCLSVSFKAPHVQDEDPRQFPLRPGRRGDVPGREHPAGGDRPAALLRYAAGVPAQLRRADALEDAVRRPGDVPALGEGLLPADQRGGPGGGRHRQGAARLGLPGQYRHRVDGRQRLLPGRARAVPQVVSLRGIGAHPLVVWDPRLPAKARGKRRREMSLNIDIAPTLLARAGVAAPPSMQGRDLGPLLRGEKHPWRREWFYSHLFRHAKIPRSEGIRTERWAYIRWLDHQREELYDIVADPHNVSNLAEQNLRQLAALRERWQAWDAAFRAWTPQSRWQEPRA